MPGTTFSCMVMHGSALLRTPTHGTAKRQFKTAKRSQVPGDATVLKQFFRDNFVIFHHRSKRIAFFESANFSTCVYMQMFNFCDGHVTTSRHHSGPVSAKCLVTLSEQEAHLRSLGFPSVPLV